MNNFFEYESDFPLWWDLCDGEKKQQILDLVCEASQQPKYTRKDVIEDLKAKFQLDEVQAECAFTIAKNLKKPMNSMNLQMNENVGKNKSTCERSGDVTDAELAAVIIYCHHF